MSAPDQRDISLDLLKAISIFFVILIHITATGFVVFGPQWNTALVFESISRVCVPIFFMVTGAIQLQKSHTILSIITKIKTVVIPLIAWSLIYILFDRYYFGTITPSWSEAIIQGPVRHLWYLYVLIGVYFFLPLMSRFCQNSSSQEKIWIIIGWIIGASVMPTYKDATGQMLTGIDMSYVPIYSGYMLVGSFIYEKIDFFSASSKKIYVVLAGFLAAVLSMSLTAYFTYRKSMIDNHYSVVFFSYYSTSVVLSAIFTFFVVTLIYKNAKSNSLRKPITFVGSTTFGIYVSHMLLLSYTPKVVDWARPMPMWLWYLLVSLLTLCLSLLLVTVIQRIPYLRKICP